MIQDSRNDWEHAVERARAVGLVLYVRQNTVFCKEAASIGAPILTLKNRKQEAWLLSNFDLSHKIPENQFGRHRHVERRVRGRGGRRLTGESSTHARGTKHDESRHEAAIHTKSYADRTAHAAKTLQREHAFVCNVRSIPPLPGIRPDFRDTIKLFSGLHLVDKVTHDHTANDFVTDYQLYRDIH
jgi:hypothetical protein